MKQILYVLSFTFWFLIREAQGGLTAVPCWAPSPSLALHRQPALSWTTTSLEKLQLPQEQSLPGYLAGLLFLSREHVATKVILCDKMLVVVKKSLKVIYHFGCVAPQGSAAGHREGISWICGIQQKRKLVCSVTSTALFTQVLSLILNIC